MEALIGLQIIENAKYLPKKIRKTLKNIPKYNKEKSFVMKQKFKESKQSDDSKNSIVESSQTDCYEIMCKVFEKNNEINQTTIVQSINDIYKLSMKECKMENDVKKCILKKIYSIVEDHKELSKVKAAIKNVLDLINSRELYDKYKNNEIKTIKEINEYKAYIENDIV